LLNAQRIVLLSVFHPITFTPDIQRSTMMEHPVQNRSSDHMILENFAQSPNDLLEVKIVDTRSYRRDIN